MAWLHAIPKPDKKFAVSQELVEPQSRLKKMRHDGVEPSLPDVPTQYLIEYLFEVGPTISTGMGPAIIGWRDLQSWQELLGISLHPWELRILRKLSADFLAQSLKSEKLDCPAPYLSPQELNRASVSKRVGNAFRSLMSAQKSR